MEKTGTPSLPEQIDITVTSIENCFSYNTHTDNWSYHPPCQEIAIMIFVLNGEAYFNVDGKEIVVKKHDIIFRNAGTGFHSRGKKDSFEYIAVHFNLTSPLSEKLIPLCAPSPEPEYTKQLFKKMLSEYGLKSPAYLLRIKSQLYKVFNHIITFNSNNTVSKKHASILPSILYMEHNIYSKDLDIETIAEQSKISSAYFRKVFREIYKVSPLKYITDKRLEKAAELLYYDNYSISHIADSVGYRYTVYFTKLFKEKYGISPSSYKRREY